MIGTIFFVLYVTVSSIFVEVYCAENRFSDLKAFGIGFGSAIILIVIGYFFAAVTSNVKVVQLGAGRVIGAVICCFAGSVFLGYRCVIRSGDLWRKG